MSNPTDTAPLTLDPVCAVIVTYFPDPAFSERLRQLLPQVAEAVIIDNTPQNSIAPCLLAAVQGMGKVIVIRNPINVGIAAALNQGLEFASKAAYEWILTLDQDTLCQPDMVQTLITVAKACKPTPLVVGSNYLDPQNNRTKVQTGGAASFLEQKTVITSGGLVNVRLATAIGGFREDYFIDQVDHEFCLRARANGHMIIITRKPIMVHSVGLSGGVSLPFLGILPNHPPLRKYYIARNTVVTIATYWRREPVWCLRRLVRLILGLVNMAVLEQNRYSKVRAFAMGIIDGIFHHLGPCRRQWLIQSNWGS